MAKTAAWTAAWPSPVHFEGKVGGISQPACFVSPSFSWRARDISQNQLEQCLKVDRLAAMQHEKVETPTLKRNDSESASPVEYLKVSTQVENI